MGPLMTGLPSRVGNHSARLPPAGLVRMAAGPLPPPDSVTPDGTAAGCQVPPGPRRRFALTGAQRPRCQTRTGSGLVVIVKVPSGFALVIDVAVVADITVTGRRDLRAEALAASIAASCGAMAILLAAW